MKSVGELMNIKIIPEILDEVAACTTEEEVRKVLFKNQSPAIKKMFELVFRPEHTFTIKELPKYKQDPGPIGLSPNSLYVELRRFYVLEDTKVIPEKKKLEILTQILESIHPTEAELVGKIIRKDLGIPLLTKEVINSVYPGLV